jgi:DNA repair protein RecO (recombination protein O)
MQWSSEAIILKHEAFSDDKLLCWLFSSTHGVYKGLLSLNKKTRNHIQIGNIVQATWQARLEEHLGTYYCELIKPLSMAILQDKLKLNSVLSLCSLLSSCLPSRVLEAAIYDKTISYLLTLKEHSNWLEDYVYLELFVLQELGYGLSLDNCAVTGEKDNLYYVSPKTGRSVSKASGEAFHDKLLILPQFIINNSELSMQDIANGLKLTGYFIEKHLYLPHQKKIPETRLKFAELISLC